MKLTAGPTPDGTFIERRTDNAYTHAVAIVSQAERVYKPRDPNADERGYIPNPVRGKYVSASWHSRFDLAMKAADKYRGNGYTAVVVPVVQP